jgi:phosphoglycolate phosphatase-like HAD superfamily hydrolase
VNILFDLDGTLTDPREGIVACIKHGLSSLGEPSPPDSDMTRFIGPPLHDTFARLLSGDRARIEAAIRAYRERFAARGMFENAVYSGIPQVLESLSALGAELFVATSKPQVFAEQILAHFGLTRHFKEVFGSELSGVRSDKGELIGHADIAERLPTSSKLSDWQCFQNAEGAVSQISLTKRSYKPRAVLGLLAFGLPFYLATIRCVIGTCAWASSKQRNGDSPTCPSQCNISNWHYARGIGVQTLNKQKQRARTDHKCVPGYANQRAAGLRRCAPT